MKEALYHGLLAARVCSKKSPFETGNFKYSAT